MIWASRGQNCWALQVGPFWVYIPFRQYGGLRKARAGIARS